jgi:glycosyltransferase involved in cell wall biosynthesis
VQANNFQSRGHQVSALLLHSLVPRLLYPGKDRVGRGQHAPYFTPGIPVYDGMDWYSPVSWLKAREFLRREQPDVLIVHWWTSSVVHMQLLLALFNRMQKEKAIFVLEMHEVVDPLEARIMPIRLYAKLTGKLLRNFCDLFTAHSEDARQQIIKAYNIPENRIFVVPHGTYDFYGAMDSSQAKDRLDLHGFVILYFGMIRQHKGVPCLIRAFDMLPGEIAVRSTLMIVGEDWGEDRELESSLRGAVYRNRIVFMPEFIPDEQVSLYFSAADIIVLPHMNSSGSGVANIAVGMGKRLITSDIPTMIESFSWYEGVTFFPVENHEALRSILMNAYEDWQLHGVRCYQFKDDTWRQIIDSYERFIRCLIPTKWGVNSAKAGKPCDNDFADG